MIVIFMTILNLHGQSYKVKKLSRLLKRSLVNLIKQIKGRQVLDSRGNPTIEADVILHDGSMGRALVPSGASKGTREAIELRDNDSKSYHGKGVLKAVQNITNVISPKIVGKDFSSQEELDNLLIELDGTESKSRLGANATLAISLAFARAVAQSRRQWLFEYICDGKLLPVPLMNILNGGVHADNNLDFQEFMIIPHGFERFSESLRAGVEVFHALKNILKEKHLSTSVGDEGGFAPNVKSYTEAIELILHAVKKAGYNSGSQISVGLDCAASELFDGSKYIFKKSGGQAKSANEMILIYIELSKTFPLISIEDGLAQDDWDGWKELTFTIGKKIQLVGDDLFVTNTKILQQGIEQKLANAILIKPNQIGTITETLQTIQLAKKANYKTVISHRSGETEDTAIADIAVGLELGQIKTGSLSRTDRTAKYNQLLRIEEYLGTKAQFAHF